MDLVASLDAAGYSVMTAGTGLAAISQIEEACRAGEMPVAAIMDVRLRGSMDGIEAASRLRQVCGPAFAVIFVTGMTDEWSMKRMSACSPAAVFTKPTDPSALIKCLRELLH